MIKKILIFALLVTISYGQSSKKILISYDFSQSMLSNGIKIKGTLDKLNNILLDILYNKNHSPNSYGVNIIKYPSEKIFPIINSNDKIVYQIVGDRIIDNNMGSDVTKEQITNCLPKSQSEFKYKNTYIAAAEAEFLKIAAADSNTLWVCITDDDKNIGNSLPKDQELQKELTQLRNEIHLTTFLTYCLTSDVNSSIRISVKKRKADQGSVLICTNLGNELKFNKITDKNQKNYLLYVSKNDENILITNQQKFSGDFHDISLNFRIVGNDTIEFANFTKNYNKLPIIIDSILIPYAQNMIKAKDLSIVVTARYIYDNKLISQDLFIKPIIISSNSNALLVLVLILLGIGIITGVLLLVKHLLRDRGAGHYYFYCDKKNKYQEIYLKKDDTIYLYEKKEYNTFDIESPYLVRKIDGINFQLEKDNDIKKFTIDEEIDLIDVNNLKIKLLITIQKRVLNESLDNNYVSPFDN